MLLLITDDVVIVGVVVVVEGIVAIDAGVINVVASLEGDVNNAEVVGVELSVLL